MGHPEDQEPTPERGDLSPERRNTRRKLTMAGVAGAATVLAGGAFLVTQTRDTKQESLPEPPPMAAVTETAPAPMTSASVSAAATPDPGGPSGSPTTSEGSTGEDSTRGNAAGENSPDGTETKAAKKSAKEIRKEIDKARAKAEADGFDLRRPPVAKGGSAGKASDPVKEWTEKTENGSVRVTTARHDLTGQSALLVAGDRGKSVGDGVNCTNKVRFSQDAPATERPTLLLCWRTSSKASVVTMMATPNDAPAADANVSIINREWAKLH